MKGRGVFAVHPTSYGKSLCLGCLPLVFDKQLEEEGEDKSRRTNMPRPSVPLTREPLNPYVYTRYVVILP